MDRLPLPHLARRRTCLGAKHCGPAWRGRLRKINRPVALIGLAAIVPFDPAPFVDANTLVFGLPRVFPRVRVRKFGRGPTSPGILGRVARFGACES